MGMVKGRAAEGASCLRENFPQNWREDTNRKGARKRGTCSFPGNWGKNKPTKQKTPTKNQKNPPKKMGSTSVPNPEL